MSKRCAYICMLMLAWGVTAMCQSTTFGVKIGNNGNVSLTDKLKAGNYTEIYRFGNGYQVGLEIHRNLCNFLGIKTDASIVNAYSEMDHDSHWQRENRGPNNYFYEEITIKNLSFNLSGSAVFNVGRFKIGVGPEAAIGLQSSGRGARFSYNDKSFDGNPEYVQYRFYSKTKQVYNQSNTDELHSYDINRVIWGANLNVNVEIFKSLGIELKGFYPLTSMIDSFTGFENLNANQKSINMQASLIYSLPLKNTIFNGSKRKKEQGT